jgi:ribonuclease P protein subunit RPR2
MRRSNQSLLSKIIKERIDKLFELAEENIKKHPERSRRYISLARKLSTRYNFRMNKKIKNRFCKKCDSLFIPGYNVKVKLNSREGIVEYHCNCGVVKNIHIGKKAKKA